VGAESGRVESGLLNISRPTIARKLPVNAVICTNPSIDVHDASTPTDP
jgi:hypothetical protein